MKRKVLIIIILLILSFPFSIKAETIAQKRKEIANLNKKTIKISALNLQGIEELYKEISEIFKFNEITKNNEIMITNVRHKNLISKAIKNINEALENLKNISEC